MEAAASRQILDSKVDSEVDQLEDEIPVECLMLFRNLAEQRISTSNPSSKTTEAHWIRQRLSNLLGVLKTSSESKSETAILREPDDEDIKEIYSALELKGNLDPHSATLYVTVEATLSQFTLKVKSEDKAFAECTASMIRLENDISGSNGSFRLTVDALNGLEQTTGKYLWWLRSRPREGSDVIVVEFNTEKPGIDLRASGIQLHPRIGLLKKALEIKNDLSNPNLEDWNRISAVLLSTRRGRILARLPTPLDFPPIKLCFNSPQICLEEGDEKISLTVKAVEFEWKKASERSESFWLSLNEDAFVNEVVEQWVYAKWKASFVGTSCQYQNKDHISTLIDPFSATGNVSLNLEVLESTLPTILCDWRLAEIHVNDLSSAKSFLNSQMKAFQRQWTHRTSRPFHHSLSKRLDRIDIQWIFGKDGISLEFERAFKTTIDPFQFERTLDVSFSYPRLKAVIHETSSSCLNLITQTGAFRLRLSGNQNEADASIQNVHLQDVLLHKSQAPPPTAFGIPHLGRNVAIKELRLSFHQQNEKTQMDLDLSGIEGNGYLHESGGGFRANQHRNALKLSVETEKHQNAIQLHLDHMAIGSTFLLRLFRTASVSTPSETNESIGGEFWKISGVTRFDLRFCNSFIGFPRAVPDLTVAGTLLDPPAVLLYLPEWTIKWRSIQCKTEKDEICGSYAEIEELNSKEVKILASASSTEPDVFFPVLDISEIVLSEQSESVWTSDTLYQGKKRRRIQNDVFVASFGGYINEALLKNVVSSGMALRNQIQASFLPSSPPMDPPAESRHGFEENVLWNIRLEEIKMTMMESTSTTSFALTLSNLWLDFKVEEDSLSSMLRWGVAKIVSSNQFQHVSSFLLKSEGLYGRGLEHPLAQSVEMGSEEKPETDEENISVSSSTSWQTAGSELVSRRTHSSSQAQPDFESVEESVPTFGMDTDDIERPLPSSPTMENLPEIEAEQAPPSEQKVFGFEIVDDGIHFKTKGNSQCLQIPSLTVRINMAYLISLAKMTTSLMDSTNGILDSSAPLSETSVMKDFELETKDIRVVFNDIPEKDLNESPFEPPTLQSECSIRSIQLKIAKFQLDVKLREILYTVCWVRCLDSVTLQTEPLRLPDSVFTLQTMSVMAQRPIPNLPSRPCEAISFLFELESIDLELSQQRIKSVLWLLDKIAGLKSLKPSTESPSGPSFIREALDFVFTQSLFVQGSCTHSRILFVDDSKSFAFPSLKGTMENLTIQAESLDHSEVIAWDFRGQPEIQLYDKQKLGWECFIDTFPITIAGKSLLATSHAFADILTYQSLEIVTPAPIEISLSPNAIKTLTQISKSIRDFPEVQLKSKEIPFVSFWIRNETGSDVAITVKGPHPERRLTLTTDTTEALCLERRPQPKPVIHHGPVLCLNGWNAIDFEDYEHEIQQSVLPLDEECFICLSDQIQPCGPLSPVHEGMTRFTIQSNPPSLPSEESTDPIDRLVYRSMPKKTLLTCEVRIGRSGGMEMSLHSDIRLVNETAYRLEIGCWKREELDPEVRFLNPTEAFWIPVATIAHGRCAVRPHPISTERFPLRCDWSPSLSFDQFPKTVTRSQWRCEPVSGGLKPIWLYVGIRPSSENQAASIHIQAPVIVHNYLPLPLNVSISCDEGVTTGLKGGLAPLNSMQGYTIQATDITMLRLTPAGYRSVDVFPERIRTSLAPMNVFGGSVEDIEGENLDIDLGSGLLPLRLHHRIEGFTGRAVFEVSCAMWIYNCTGNRFAVRAMALWEEEEEARGLEEDDVPDRWMLPYTDVPLQGSLRTSTSAAALGLQCLLEKGNPERFRFRSPPGETQSKGISIGSQNPSFEIKDDSNRRPFRLQFRTSGSKAPPGGDYWSDAVSIDTPGSVTVVRCAHPIEATATSPAFRNAAYFLAVSVVPIPNSANTSALHVMPRTVLTNSTSFHFQYRQQGVRLEKELSINVPQSLHWPDATKPLRLSVRIREAGWMWSGGLRMDVPGDTIIKLRHRVREETKLIQLDVNLQSNGVLLAILTHQESGFAPYRLDNFTSEKVHVRQKGKGNQEDILRPYASMPYAWDEPSGIHKVVLETPGRKLIGNFHLDAVGTELRVTLLPESADPYTNRTRRLKILIQAKGPTRVLSILDEDVHPLTLTPRQASTPQTFATSRFGHVRRRGIEIRIEIQSLGISLVSNQREMAYCRMTEPFLQVDFNDDRFRCQTTFSHFQLDTCLRNVTYPVWMSCPVTFETWTDVVRSLRNRKALDITVAFWKRPSGGVLCMETLKIDLAPLSLNIEEQSLRSLLRFLQEFIPQPKNEAIYKPDCILTSAKGSTTTKSKIYIEDLSIALMRLTFSFAPGSDRPNVSESGLWRRILPLATFEGAQIRLRPLKLKHPLVSSQALTSLVVQHYTTAVLQELYKVVGSADILGDPVHLVQRLGLGVWLFFANPTYALVKSRSLEPWRLMDGLLAGVRSLVSNVLFGFTNAIAKLSLAGRRSLILFLQLETSKTRSKKTTDLVQIVLESMVGVLSSAARGLDEGGLVGFLKGSFVGWTMFIARPSILLLEIVYDLTESISNAVSGATRARLLREPRYISPKHPLGPYDPLLSIGAMILKDLWNGAFSEESLIHCLPAWEPDGFLLITRRFFIQAHWKSIPLPNSQPNPILILPLENIECIRLQGRQIHVFGFAPLPWKRSRLLFSLPLVSPFFSESIQCANLATSCQLSVTLKVLCQAASRSVVQMGHGYHITNV